MRQESTSKWISALSNPAWQTDGVDAVLLRLSEPAVDVEDVVFGKTLGFDETIDWETTAYPGVAATTPDEGTPRRYPTSGLDGAWYPQGGQGQLSGSLERFLDLGVEKPPTDWHGISGAPIFVAGELIGVIASAPPDYENCRLRGVPIEHVVNSPAFIATATENRHSIPREELWFLVLWAEKTRANTKGLVQAALKTFEGQRRRLPPLEFENVHVAEVAVDVNAGLDSPGSWLRLVELLTLAPVAVIDVSNFEPAVMLALGVRAVARRGVTVTVTHDSLTEANLTDLPFNIKETRLVSLNSNRADSRDGKDALVDTIQRGLAEQDANSDYLDLPAYESVRGRRPRVVPERYAEFLVLCSFDDRYEPHWRLVRDAISRNFPGHKGVRMLDMSSPRLTGQALYEQIRWNDYCLVDWTEWRPNVFFELGVRLGCSRYDPIMAIHETGHYVSKQELDQPSRQQSLLISLFQPVTYVTSAAHEQPDDEDPNFDRVLRRYRTLVGDEEVNVENGAIPPGATYEIMTSSYYWAQEPLLERPDTSLRRQIEARVGADSQRVVGESDILFSSNRDFSQALEHSMREDWMAAWFYARGRAGQDPSPEERSALVALGENAMQALSRSRSAAHRALHAEIGYLLGEWEDDDY
ncbi:MAG: hypothetical protein KAZ88_12210 [Acidimicrobiia bacterium]|nr:hypothetical protein [Acidimicrobiia bacterium]